MARQFVFFGRSSSLLMLIFYKLLLSAIEFLAGSLCLLIAFFAKHLDIVEVIERTGGNDYLDRFIHWLVQQMLAFPLDYELMQHVGVILIALALFNVIVAVGVWFKSNKMRRIALVVFGALTLYSIYQLIENISALNVISIILDLIIFYYFWRILPRHFEQ